MFRLVFAVQNRGSRPCRRPFIAQLALIYVSFLQNIFQTEVIGMSEVCTLPPPGAVSVSLDGVRRRYERSQNATMTFSSAVEELA